MNSDKDRRYYIDIDTRSNSVINWDSGERFKLRNELLPQDVVRIYITKGQFNKLK